MQAHTAMSGIAKFCPKIMGCFLEIRQSSIGRWDKRLSDQASDVPINFFIIISYTGGPPLVRISN